MAVIDKNTVALLYFDGGLTDESGKVWTAKNGATTSNTQSKFGESSLYLNGNQYLTTPISSDLNFGNEDFTIDWWEYRTPGNTGAVFSNGDGYCGIILGYIANGVFTASIYGSWDFYNVSMGSYIYGAWTHYAVVRNGSKFYTFQNGIQKSTWTSTKSIYNTGGSLYLGSYGGGKNFAGYIDEFRISNIARWTSDFTPPTSGVSIKPPTNLTTSAGDSQVTLSWDAVTGVTGYNVKRSITAGGSYTTIATNVTGTSYVDNTVANGTTYYYAVTAVDSSNNESANSNEASATPVAAQVPTGQALLRVTMIDSSEREYRLSTAEIDGFINWYNSHKSTDTTSYAINDSVDRSKEYLSFDKIISFKVIPLKD